MKMKKLMLTLGAALASVVSFAEETAASVGDIVTVTQVEEIFTKAQENMTDLIDVALPVVIAFVGGGLIIWGALALVSLLKRGFGAAKGR